MKKQILILLCIFLIGFVNASNISIDYPDNVNYGEEFSVDVELIGYEGIYDVKIDILNSTGDRLSEIDNNGEWRSTHYYVEDAIDTSSSNISSFSLNITQKYEGEANINVKIRDTSIDSYEDYLINIDFQDEDASSITYDPVEIILDWDDEDIINGEEFEIEIYIENLEDEDYDLKLWIEFEDEDIVISDRYDDNEDEWKSGSYYISNVFSGPGEDEEKIKLRIREDYRDYEGWAIIYAKLRGEETFDEDIEILKQEEDGDDDQEEDGDDEDNEESNNQDIDNNPVGNTDNEAILLIRNNDNQTEDIKTDNNIIYKSKNQYIKEYAIYGFTFLCIILIILLLIDRK